MPRLLAALLIACLAVFILGWAPVNTHAYETRRSAPSKPACCCATGQCHMSDCYGNKALAARGPACSTTCRGSSPKSATRIELRHPAPMDSLPVRSAAAVPSQCKVSRAEYPAALRSVELAPLDRPPCMA